MESKSKSREFIQLYTYYFIIAIVSLIALFFLPFLGSEVGLGMALPNTVAGWIVWTVTKIIVAVINILIFHNFMQQAKVNVKDDPRYIEAKTILGKIRRKNYTPRAPERWVGAQYGKKGTMIFITTALATVALTQAILTFDWVSMLTYFFTIIMGLIFGVLQMKSAEIYWTEEFWDYAKMVERDMEEAKKERAEQKHDTVDTDSRNHILEPVHCDGIASLNCEPMVLDRLLNGDSFLVRPDDTSNTAADRPGTDAQESVGQEDKNTTPLEVNNDNNK